MRLDRHLAKLEGHLRAAGIPMKQAKLYKKAAEKVLRRMTPEALKRVGDNVKAYYFYPDLAALEAEGGEGTLGFYRTSNGTLHLDGGGEGGDSIHRIYAHEYTHALDGPDDDISGSEAWQAAWQEEMVEGGALGEVAADSPDEGLAQLGEWMLRNQLEVARQLCPKCVAIWEGLGL
jgi:hypothetical protein